MQTYNLIEVLFIDIYSLLHLGQNKGEGSYTGQRYNFTLSQTKHLINAEIPYQTSSAGKGRLTWLYNSHGLKSPGSVEVVLVSIHKLSRGTRFAFLVHSTSTFQYNPSSMDSPG